MIHCYIPARLNSSRFPNKILHKIDGVPLLIHVIRNAVCCPITDRVTVVGAEQSIEKVLEDYGYKSSVEFVLNESGSCGTHRVFSYLNKSKSYDKRYSITVLQADTIGLTPDMLCRFYDSVQYLQYDSNTVFSMYCDINYTEAVSPNNVKVVVDKKNYAMYFSRSIIPYSKINLLKYNKHIGIYHFPADCVKSFLDDSVLFSRDSDFKTEDLEQLHWMENGKKLKMIHNSFNVATVDSVEDVNK